MINFWGSDGFDKISMTISVVESLFRRNEKIKPKELWFKGGSSSDNVDEKYNARMATIAEAQQDMAEDYFNYWEGVYKPLESAQAEADMSLISSETEAAKNQALLDSATATSELGLLPAATNAAAAEYEATSTLLPAQTEYALGAMQDSEAVRTSFYDEAMNGVDIEKKADQAAADAANAFVGSNSAMNRSSASMGINPNSGRFSSMANQNSLNMAKAVGTARTTARTNAENENFDRLSSAMSTTVSV